MDSRPFYLDKVAIRMVKEPPLYSEVPINNPQAAVKLMADTLSEYDREVFAIINFRPDLKPINVNFVSMGALDQSLVHPREAIKSMVLSNAASVMMVHNHTTGAVFPSKEDVAVTDRMAQLCGMLGIKLLDHVIVGPGNDYYSFHEKGVLPVPNLKFETNIDCLEYGGMKVAETATMKKQEQKMSTEEYREMKEAELKAITDKLEQGVSDVFSSDKYKQFLDTMAKFPRYSVNNNILIMMQKPDAQMCQSFTGWKEMGRFVKKGEKGIKILAPAPYTIQREQTKLDDRGNPMMDKDGEPIMESVEIKVNAFKVVSTFDVSQTDGKELPTLDVDELTGGVDGYGTFLEALKEVCPVPMTFENIEGGAKGFYSQTEKRIAIQEGMSEAQTVKTAIHEMAHQKLHAIENNGPKQTRGSKEVEAESVAYTVCQHYGIDTSDYSFSYVAGWSEGKEMPELKASLDTILRAASEMITAIDEKVEELVAQKTQEQIAEVPENVKNDATDRKEELAELLKATAEKMSPDAKTKQEEKSLEKENPATEETEEKPKEKTAKKTSVKSKLKEGKEKVAKTPAKKTKEKEAQACV